MIVLCMIVKNEAHVIRRCLESALPFVDRFVIHDTGSTDGTLEIIRECIGDRLGVLDEREWVDFSANRNAVLDHARVFYPDAYALTLDADEILEDDLGARFMAMPKMGAGRDGFTLDVEYAGTHYRRLSLIRLSRPWRWVGPVHEYLELEGATTAHLTAPTVRVFHEGARSQDPETYRKDAALLEQALVAEPDHPRWQFYLAQSYRDAGLTEAAFEAYAARAENLGGWWEERWFSVFRLGQLAETLGLDPIAHYLNAYDLNWYRAEPLVALAKYERLRERFHVAALYAEAACEIVDPESGLFIDQFCYDVARWDELALAGWYSGEPNLDAAQRAADASPNDPRLLENLRLTREAIEG